jgi:hypothetical protein
MKLLDLFVWSVIRKTQSRVGSKILCEEMGVTFIKDKKLGGLRW